MVGGKRFPIEKVSVVLRVETPRSPMLLDRFPFAPAFFTFLLKGSRLWVAVNPIFGRVDSEHIGHPVVGAGTGGGQDKGKQQEQEMLHQN